MHVFVYRGDGVCMYRTDIYMCICSEKTCKWDQFVLKNWFIYIVNDEFITENILKHKTFSWCLCLYGATTHANETDLYCKVISKYYIWGTHHREHSQTQDVLLMFVSIWSNSTCKCHQFMLQNWFVYYKRRTHHREYSQKQDMIVMYMSIWGNDTCKCDRFTYGRNLPQRPSTTTTPVLYIGPLIYVSLCRILVFVYLCLI